MGSSQVNQTVIAKAIEAANNGLCNSSSGLPVANINRSEAARINLWANILYQNTNADAEANHRYWIHRFLNVTDEERNAANEGDDIKTYAPGETVMNSLSDKEKRFDNNQENWEATKENWSSLDKGRRAVERTDPRATNERTGSQFNESFKTTDKVWDRKDGKKPPEQSRPNVYNGEVTKSQRLGNSIGKASAGGKFRSLVFEYFKWQTFHQRMEAVTNYITRKEKLEREIRAENSYIVPIKPSKIEEIIKDFRYYGTITANLSDKRRIIYNLNHLQLLLEESYAFWGKKKK